MSLAVVSVAANDDITATIIVVNDITRPLKLAGNPRKYR
jgi:hypothetical protein